MEGTGSVPTIVNLSLRVGNCLRQVCFADQSVGYARILYLILVRHRFSWRGVLLSTIAGIMTYPAWSADPRGRASIPEESIEMTEAIHSDTPPSCATGKAMTIAVNGRSMSALSLQDAIDRAAPGAVILVPNCTYYEELTISKPLTLRAATLGGVTLTGAVEEPPVYSLVDPAIGLYKAPVECSVAWAMYRDRSLMDYKNYSNLMSLTFPTGSRLAMVGVAGPDEGFVTFEGNLYVRLRGGINPSDPTVDLRPSRCGAARGIFIKSSDVVVEGLNITNFPVSGIAIDRSANNVQIRNNRFSGTQTGIRVWNSASDRSIVVENNEYSGKPTYEYRRSGNQKTWAGLYDSNLVTRFFSSATNGLTIRGNYVYEAFDGIEVKGGSATLTPATVTEISRNVVQNIVDNPFEFDTALKIADIRVHHNLAIDAYAYVSLAPFQAGKIMLDHNIFYASPEHGLQRADWLKLKLHDGTNARDPFTNITIVHNTVLLGDSEEQNSRLYQDDKNLKYHNCLIANNALMFRTTEAVYTLGSSADSGSLFVFRGNLIWGTHTNSHPYPGATLHDDPLLKVEGGGTFSPPANSPLVDNGIANAEFYQTPLIGAPDIGAIEAGVPLPDSWPLARHKPGPSWRGARSSLRPSLPASLLAVWAGL
jgi:hypothetical protein